MVLPETGKFYKHFKGHVYSVEGVAKHSETLEPMILYKDTVSGELWARPANMWFDLIERDSYKGPRFSLLDPEPLSQEDIDYCSQCD